MSTHKAFFLRHLFTMYLEFFQGIRACHMTYQLKISSMHLWLVDQWKNRIQIPAFWLVGQPQIHGGHFKMISRSRDKPDTLQEFWIALLFILMEISIFNSIIFISMIWHDNHHDLGLLSTYLGLSRNSYLILGVIPG